MCARDISNTGRAKAICLVALMILLPWGTSLPSSFGSQSLSDDFDMREESSGKSWGVNGSNDTGWIVLEATGADAANGTPALADLFLEFAPGAVIDNLTLEISVNGSDGYWVNQPQIAVMDTQTSVLDWSGRGDLGRQNNFADNPPSLVGGILDASLKPNTISDASWQIPSGIEITDLVIEALRPVDPKLSFSPLEVSIHGSAYNPIDGRMNILVDDDLLQLDDNANKRIIDIIPDIVVFSKALGNGYPIACIGGNRGVMDAAKDSFISSTTHTESIGFAAMSAVLDYYQENDVSSLLGERGSSIKDILYRVAANNGLDIKISGLDQLWSWSFNLDGELNRKLQTVVTEHMLIKSILFSNRFYATLGIDSDFYQIFERSLEEAFNKVSQIIKSGDDPINHIKYGLNKLGIYK